MKTFLFPTDFSPCADNAFQYAANLAVKANAKIILHHTSHISAYPLNKPAPEGKIEETISKKSLEKLNKCIDEAGLKNKNIPVETDVNFGLAVNNIISLSKEKKVDLIVMGTKGASGLDEIIIGSNASRVIEDTECPVLIIPDRAKSTEIKNILFATDFHDNDMESIKFLSDIAQLYNAELKITHVSDAPQLDAEKRAVFHEFKNEVTSLISYKKLNFELLMGWNVAEILNDTAKEDGTDLIGISMRKRNFISRFFSPSITRKMTYHSDVPLLVFHA